MAGDHSPDVALKRTDVVAPSSGDQISLRVHEPPDVVGLPSISSSN